MALLCTETCMTLIYILDVCEAWNFLSFFTAKEITLDEELLLPDVVPDDHAIGIGPRCCKNVQRA